MLRLRPIEVVHSHPSPHPRMSNVATRQHVTCRCSEAALRYRNTEYTLSTGFLPGVAEAAKSAYFGLWRSICTFSVPLPESARIFSLTARFCMIGKMVERR